MMNESTCNGPESLNLSREQAWVLHAAVLDRAEQRLDDDDTPEREVELLDAIEACDELTAQDLDSLADTLATFLEDAPQRDRWHGRAVLDNIEAARAKA